MFFASTMFMVSIALVMAVIVTNIYAKKNTSQRCPPWAVHLASRFFPSYSLPERESNASLVSLASGKDPELQAQYPQRQTPPSRPRSANTVSSSTVRRGTSPGGSGVGRRGPETGGSSGGGGAAERRARRMQRTAASVSTDSTMYPRQSSEEGSIQGNSQDRADRARSKAEWRLAAMMADRVFLWVFVVISVSIHANMLFQMVFQPKFGD